MQYCYGCKKNLPREAYYASTWGSRRGGYCKVCHREFYRAKTKDDPRYFLKYQQARREKHYNKLHALKEAMGCSVCGGHFHPAALDFHHRDPSTKKCNLSRAWQLSWSGILAEVAKCDLICANCHRTLHFEERRRMKKAIKSLVEPTAL